MAWPRNRTGIDRGRRAVLILAALSALATLTGLCGCFDAAEDETWFDIEADPSLTGYSRVTVLLQDSLGGDRAVLFDDSLPTVRRLRRLPAGPYRGEAARIVLLGYRNGKPRYRETRHYAGLTQTVIAVDIFLGPFDAAASPAEPPGAPPQGPVIAGRMPDTAVSIRDSVSFWALLTDADGDLAGYAYDCDGDGKFEDSAGITGSKVLVRGGRRYPDSGGYVCDLKAWDRGGRAVRTRMEAQVELDRPVARAGEDTTVVAGSLILLHANGDDRFGPILTREWKVGSEPFAPVPQLETVRVAPSRAGILTCILRVTDSDGLAGTDTLLVTVIAAAGAP